jgi:hypothetical protein
VLDGHEIHELCIKSHDVVARELVREPVLPPLDGCLVPRREGKDAMAIGVVDESWLELSAERDGSVVGSPRDEAVAPRVRHASPQPPV